MHVLIVGACGQCPCDVTKVKATQAKQDLCYVTDIATVVSNLVACL